MPEDEDPTPAAAPPAEAPPDERALNPGGLVYGVLAVGTVIAAESTRRETFATLLAASAVTMAVYWLAHAYSTHWATRVADAAEWSAAELLTALRHEASILLGAAAPVAVLAVAWAAGATRGTAVTAVLWCSGAELVTLELGAGIRAGASGRDLAVQTGTGLSMGLGILALRLLLH